MRRILRGSALLVLLLNACSARPSPAPEARAAGPRRVVFISLDGFRHDYPERAPTPTFDRLAREGARAKRLIPPDPSLTFPSHATLATGVPPVKHGILGNRFFDRIRGSFDYADDPSWYAVDPLWIHTTRLGLRTHVFHWVGSGGARGGVEPAEWRPFSKLPDDQKIDQILAWLRAPEAERPRLIMSYLAGCDHVGHERGPESEAVTACIVENDARLGRLIEGLAALPDPVTLLVVSDHGMTATRASVDPRPAFAHLEPGARIITGGPVTHVYLPEGADLDAAQAAAAQLPHTRVSRPAGAQRHPSRSGDLLLQADFGVIYSTRPAHLPYLAGHHGGNPEHPDMGAIFYAWGDGVAPGGRLGRLQAQDLAPTICALLEIPPLPAAEGKALALSDPRRP